MTKTLKFTLPIAPDRAFYYLARTQHLRRWVSTGATHFEPQLGGFFLLSLPDEHHLTGTVSEYEPDTKLTLTATDLTLAFELAEASQPSHTTLTLTLAGKSLTKAIEKAFQTAGENLTQLLTTGIDPRRNGQALALPATRDDVATVYKDETDRLMWLVAESCDSLTEDQARLKPTPTEWSVNQILAHLILTEQDNRYLTSAFFAGSEPANMKNLKGCNKRLAAVIAYCQDDMWQLLDSLRSEHRATLAFIRALPEVLIAEPVYFRVLAENFHYTYIHTHTEEHLAQLRTTKERIAIPYRP